MSVNGGNPYDRSGEPIRRRTRQAAGALVVLLACATASAAFAHEPTRPPRPETTPTRRFEPTRFATRRPEATRTMTRRPESTRIFTRRPEATRTATRRAEPTRPAITRTRTHVWFTRTPEATRTRTRVPRTRTPEPTRTVAEPTSTPTLPPEPTQTATVTATPTPDGLLPDFLGDVTAGISPLAVNFTDLSTGAIESWLWDFGDGDTSSEQHPTHVYAFGGAYTVSLTITGPLGAATETKVDFVVVQGGGGLN